MKAAENKAILFETLEPKLVADDDRALWQAALFVLTDEFTQRQADESQRGVWAIVVGACSHWVRPHNSRWNAAGGFVYPDGYKDSVPDWTGPRFLSFGTENGYRLKNSPEKRLRSSELRFPREPRVTDRPLSIHDGHPTEKPFCMDSER
jgi:hypothetical protein